MSGKRSRVGAWLEKMSPWSHRLGVEGHCTGESERDRLPGHQGLHNSRGRHCREAPELSHMAALTEMPTRSQAL